MHYIHLVSIKKEYISCKRSTQRALFLLRPVLILPNITLNLPKAKKWFFIVSTHDYEGWISFTAFIKPRCICFIFTFSNIWPTSSGRDSMSVILVSYKCITRIIENICSSQWMRPFVYLSNYLNTQIDDVHHTSGREKWQIHVHCLHLVVNYIPLMNW